MNIVNIEDKQSLNNFLIKQKHSQFLQSWEWGEFQKKAGNKVFHLGIEEDAKLISVITFIKKDLFLGKSYFYAPRVLINNEESSNLAGGLKINNLFNRIKKIAQAEKCIFLRFDPINKFQISDSKFHARQPIGQIQKTIDIQASKTLILNIEKSEDEILKSMHQKTRYNIRLALKKGVVVKEIKDVNSKFDEFWNLMQETESRDGFRLHAKRHYQNILSLDSDSLKLIGAFYKEKLIVANIVSFFGDMVTYVHGASSSEDRNLMAPYALQWETIKIAKEEGYKYYDFNGIDENKWPGVTRFKKGFGGEEINYPGTFDLVFNSLQYNVYKFLRKLRRMV